ncbi:MAG: MYG1 family protein [Myxococcota bacterium]
MLVATHDGPFHADDVMAFALLRVFVDAEARVVRTRDPGVIAGADAVIDVGGVHDPAARRFDHHQASYEGTRSSAGMVLDWLAAEGRLSVDLAERLRNGTMNYLDDVDTGRRAPDPVVPCFPRIVEALNQPASDHAGYDAAFLGAAAMAEAWLRGTAAQSEKVAEARALVREAMARAVAEGTQVIELERYVPWKEPYFEAGGGEHPTAFVLHPGTDGSWRAVAIPPVLGDFGQKVPFPAAWAGLSDAELEAQTGVAGSVFCHKNRFIAVWKTRAAAVETLQRHGLWAPG